MAGINKAMIIGRLGRDPEIRYTQDGKAIASFSVATSEEWTDKLSGEKKERTEWHRIVAFGKLGELCGEYLKKGRQVFVEGRLQTRSWEKDGVTRYTTEIVASEVQFLGSRDDGAPGASRGSRSGYDAGPAGSNRRQDDYDAPEQDRGPQDRGPQDRGPIAGGPNPQDEAEEDIPF